MEVDPSKDEKHHNQRSNEEFVFTELPSADKDVGRQTQCLVRLSLIRHIASIPGYPRKPVHPEEVYCRICASPNGLGMFATRDLSMGQLIFTERPLTLTPTYLHTRGLENYIEQLPPDQRGRAILAEWDRRFLRPLISRLNPEDKIAFMELAKSRLDDDSGPILDVIRTNGLDPSGLIDPMTGDEYAAVCKTMSRINHSCSPSADRLFDLASFSFQLRATRDIKEGEEIFISYCDVCKPVSDRQEDLADWGFTCTCESCLSETESDKRRLAIKQSVDAIGTNFRIWVCDLTLADDFIVRASLHWISIIEEEGLETLDAYRAHLNAIVNAYVALGNAGKAVEYGRKLGLSSLGQSGHEEVLRTMQDASYLQKRLDWKIRVSEDTIIMG